MLGLDHHELKRVLLGGLSWVKRKDRMLDVGVVTQTVRLFMVLRVLVVPPASAECNEGVTDQVGEWFSEPLYPFGSLTVFDVVTEKLDLYLCCCCQQCECGDLPPVCHKGERHGGKKERHDDDQHNKERKVAGLK